MPPPTNIDFAHATELGPLPNTVTQDVDFGGTTYTVYYKLTATYTGMVGILALGDNVTDVYVPRLDVYEQDQTTIVLGQLVNIDQIPVQFPVVSGRTYYFKIIAATGNVSPAVLTLRGTAQPSSSTVIDDLFINDDTPDENGSGTKGLWAAVLSQTDGTIKNFIKTVNGESGDTLPNGVYALTNEDDPGDTQGLTVYSANNSVIGFVALASPGSVRSNGNNKFYVANGTTVKAVDAAATVVGSWTLPSTPLAIAPSRDDSILYWTVSGLNPPVKRWDLVNNIALSDLAPAPSGYTSGLDILILANGHILVTWIKLSPLNIFFREYDASGTTIRDYTYTPPTTRSDGPRMALNAADDSSAFWAWASGFDANINRYSLFDKFRTSDGAITTTFTALIFESGIGPTLTTDISTIPSFGNSKSCPIFAVRVASGPPAPSLEIVKTTSDQFIKGGSGSFQLVVSNVGTASQTDPVTVTDTLPAGFTLVSMSGVGWTCVNNICTRSDILPAGNSYPPITVVVNVSPSATSPQVNNVSANSATGSLSVPIVTAVGGMYKIDYNLQKTNDTVYTDPTIPTSIVVKIPDPKIRLSALGD